MPQERFSLENLPHLDFGKVPVAFDAEIKRVIQDCMDRPTDDKPRQVAIVFNIVPVPESTGSGIVCDEVAMEVEIDSKVPKRRTKVYAMKTKANGDLMFHPDLPDAPDDETLMDEVDRNHKGRRAS